MNAFDDALWNSLEAMRIAPEGAALSFEARLAREQGWSAAFTQEVMREYRRFLYLAATAPGPVTPSEAVDAAWHLHLSYTRHYWDKLCPKILGRPLHHNPTEGGPVEQARYRDQYAATLAHYEAAFGAAPPTTVWPGVDARFSPAPHRVPTGALAIAGLASVLLAACTALAGNAGAGDGNATAIAVVAVVGGIFVFVVLVALLFGAKMKRKRADGSCSAYVGDGGGSDGGDSGCGGGCGGGGGD